MNPAALDSRSLAFTLRSTALSEHRRGWPILLLICSSAASNSPSQVPDWRSASPRFVPCSGELAMPIGPTGPHASLGGRRFALHGTGATPISSSAWSPATETTARTALRHAAQHPIRASLASLSDDDRSDPAQPTQPETKRFRRKLGCETRLWYTCS